MSNLLRVIQRLRSRLLDRIYVDRANARVTDFKILRFVPPYLQSYEHPVFQLSAPIVNLQFPLIKEGWEATTYFG